MPFPYTVPDTAYSFAWQIAMSTTPFTGMLDTHDGLCRRRRIAEDRLKTLRNRFGKDNLFSRHDIAVYCAGSIARGDVGLKSDLDLFLLSAHECKRLDSFELIAHAIQINRELGFPSFSNDGKYLQIYSLTKMRDSVGTPSDDHENTFTARMLLLLESRPLTNDALYDNALTSILGHYFRDSRGKTSFRPLFLINDLLRYWRTLCLNYEQIRDDPTKPWHKKNINLKFSRMLTVFGTVLPVIVGQLSTSDDVRRLVRAPPLERLAHGLNEIGDRALGDGFSGFLDNYEQFLSWKEELNEDPEKGDEIEEKVRVVAGEFSEFLYQALTHSKIERDLRKYLVL